MAERSHLVKMHVKNIGCIGNDGLTVELDEIVCLVGPNNAGKTTVLRAYEYAVNSAELKVEDFNRNASGNPASVELWVHIPKAAANVDEKWKEEKDGLLLVRSKWTWECHATEVKTVKPVRTTWDPSANGALTLNSIMGWICHPKTSLTKAGGLYAMVIPSGIAF